MTILLPVILTVLQPQSHPVRPASQSNEATTSSERTEDVTETTTERNTNRLIDATSPYLLQHAHNPVDWHEWGEESLSKAKKEDKPIFLSIGYAACHWCHVMEHESFESEDVAAVLNESFVSIKVDREERPDIDEIYMAYTQQATGGGGWPMSVWLTPDGRPFYAGTYFPRAQFVNLLKTISDAWLNRRDEVLAGAQNAKKFFDQWAQGPAPAEGVIPKQVVIQTADLLAQHFDKAYGGLAGGGTNKFPPSMAMELMLRANEHEPKNEYIDAVVLTLDQMARGGIYDHIGGGICRYSTDLEWLVPHFEKMLYDQAMVSSIYLDGYQATGRGQFADVARDIFAYVLEDLTDPQGGFYSSRDADSDGLEGAFYIWTVEEVHELLGTEDGPLFCSLFDVTERGNWFERLGHAPPGPKNILRLRKPIEGFAKANGINPAELQTRVDNWRSTLKQARNKRTPPGLDDKILTGWNGLMIASLARASRVLDEPEFAAAAAKAADFILDSLQKDGRLLRTFRNGKARLTGYLSDYAFFVEALINLYQATFERKWLAEAQRLADVAVAQYHDDKNGGFYFTADDGEELIVRAKSAYDGAIPSGNSVMAMNLLRLAILLDRKDYRDLAESTFRVLSPRVERNPLAFEKLLCAVDFYHDRVKEIAVIGDPSAADTRALLETVDARYMPNKVLALAHPPASASISDSDGADLKIPLLSGKKKKDGSATAYVCERYRCRLPVTTPEALRMELDRK